MDNLRREQLTDNWDSECNSGDPSWRKELTAEELDFVASLDRGYRRGMLTMASAILVREKVRSRFRPGEIAELVTIRDHCRLRLRDGRLYLARLNDDNSLRLDEIDGVC